MSWIFPFRKKRASTEDVAFLPAALEIVETPPSPVGRSITYSIVALFSCALVWASVGRIDVVASAKGQIIPSGQTKVIQPFETGVVRAIHVHDGQIVKGGDRLIELDPTINDAEWKHYESDLVAAQLDVQRLQAELSEGDPLAQFKAPASAPESMVTIQRQFLIDQLAEQHEKLGVFDRKRKEKQAEYDTTEATIEKLQATLPILAERVDIRKTLYDHTTGSKAAYLELLQPYVEQQHELEVDARHLAETTAAIATIDEQRAEAIMEFRRERYADLAEAERKARGLSEDLIRAKHRAALQVLTAPVDGTIQQLAVHTVGGVVTPAQKLMVLVPSDSRLEIEAMVLNRDIGFVHAGQSAKIKVDAFDFNRYGMLDGRVVSVSPDSIARERSVDKSNSTAQDGVADSSEPPDQELVYSARVSLADAQMRIDGKTVRFSPGMAVTVEIRTGSRRIISYLLSPVLTYAQDSLHER